MEKSTLIALGILIVGSLCVIVFSNDVSGGDNENEGSSEEKLEDVDMDFPAECPGEYKDNSLHSSRIHEFNRISLFVELIP